MANHAVFASSDIRATRAGHILNFVHTADCDNGTIWAQGDLVGQGVDRECYKCKLLPLETKYSLSVLYPCCQEREPNPSPLKLTSTTRPVML